MPLHDYLIDHSELDWAALLRDWTWLVPNTLTVWLMNRFGDLVIVTDDEKIHFLDLGGGTLVQIADSRDDFRDRIDEGDNANQWLMIPLIDKLVAANINLGKGQCYGYKVPPVLGGDYTVENTCVLPIPEQYGICASIHQQIKDVPDGTKVEIKIVNGPTQFAANED